MENLHVHHKMMPHAVDVLKKLKESGIMLAVCSNSNTPLKRIKVIEESLGIKVNEIFDAFIVSAEHGVRKPNPAVLDIVKNKFPDIKPYEMVMIGDQMDRDIECAHRSNIRSIYMAYCPENLTNDEKALGKGELPDFHMIDLRQVEFLLKIMDKDVKFIEA